MKLSLFKKSSVFMTLSLLILCSGSVFSEIITNVPPDISSKELTALVIEDFENSPNWTVLTVPKKFTKTDEAGKKNKDPLIKLDLKVIDGFPSDMKEQTWQFDNKGMKKSKILGVNFQFRYPGYNSVHMIPAEPIKLPGRAKALSIWIHGRGNAYTLEAWVKDHEGNTHIMKFGNVNFVGWKPLQTEIPVYIPQEVNSYPQTKILTIERFVLRADPREQVTNTFFFFDQLKVLTETYEVNFDGQKLEDAFNQGGGATQEPPAAK